MQAADTGIEHQQRRKLPLAAAIAVVQNPKNAEARYELAQKLQIINALDDTTISVSSTYS